MGYVEWLRVRGALKWTAIVLGVLFVLACVGRISIMRFEHHSMAMHEMKFAYFVLVGSVLAMIVATILGAPFARENDGHLEVALTQPAGRVALALRTIGIDVAGIVAALALGIVFGIAAHTIFWPPKVTFHVGDAIALALGIMAPLAWYAMLAAATASLKRGYAAILGVAWPVAAIVAGVALIDVRDNAMFALIHDAFWALSLIDPLAYMHIVVTNRESAVDPAWLSRLTMLAVLAFGYGALAIAQWRRVEA
ncbi:MAG: hypothetical protein ABI231_12170 [Candidatus Tumulicola sp.]